MARTNSRSTTQDRDGQRDSEAGGRGSRMRDREGARDGQRHEHRTAKVVELIGSSTRSFEDAVRAAIQDAAETTRGITGASVDGFSVKCQDGQITEYKASIKVAFGVERT